MSKAVKNIVPWAIAGLLACASAGCYWAYYQEAADKKQLELQLAELTQKERHSMVVQRISTQMEEIAREQQIISDEQRKEAEEQSIVANKMRLQAEQEQHKALEAEHQARLSERKAVDASGLAEQQRQLAVERQHEAEYSRSVADTLSYLSMARSLGSLAVTQLNTGNEEIASILAYAAYTYTKRYHGDVYMPAIYEALALTSGNSKRWTIGRGSIMKTIEQQKDKSSFIAISTYGQITKNTMLNGQLQSKTILADSRYDFRDLLLGDDDKIFALSYNGHLLSGQPGQLVDYPLTGANNCFRLFRFNKEYLTVVSEQCVYLIDANTMKTVKTLPLNFKTHVAGEKRDMLCLFDEKGQMYTVNENLTKITQQALPFRQPIMSYTYQWATGKEAYGTCDGVIYLRDNKGTLSKLVGHRSRVSRVKFAGDLLYSTSYDGTVRFWNINSEKIEPMTILKSNQWVICFAVDDTKNFIWTGDQKGSVNQTMISVDLMAEKVHNNLKRDFTAEEWSYYIGNNVPYESFKAKRP